MLRVIHKWWGCANKLCPTVFEDSDGSIVVQGYKLSESDRKDIELPDTEDAVRIPRELYDAIRAG